jgi:hypothetical protein
MANLTTTGGQVYKVTTTEARTEADIALCSHFVSLPARRLRKQPMARHGQKED